MNPIIGWIKEFNSYTEDDYLGITEEVAAWITAHEHVTADGIYWDVIPDKHTDDNAVLTSITSLYGGAAGIAIFFLRLYRVTGNPEYLEKARGGVDFCISKDPGVAAYFDYGEATLRGIPTGLMNGPAGSAYAAYLLYEDTKDEKYRSYTELVADILISVANRDEIGFYWSGTFSMLADGGLTLFLIWLYEKTGNRVYLEAADQSGKRIASQAVLEDGTAKWYAMDTVAFGLGENGYFPGFFYGTAGTGYILGKLYEHTKDESYLTLATQAAAYIVSIAEVTPDGSAALVRYNDPYVTDMHYIGVCQGPPGTSRLFYQLYQLTGKEVYREWIIRLTNGIHASGAPGRHSKGFWHTYNYCCGTAGLVEHYIDMYDFTGEESYLEDAIEAANTMIRDSNLDDGQRRWYTTWNRHEPDATEGWNGLYVGSAGCASAVLRVYNATHEWKDLGQYIEDPYQKK